MECNVDGLGMTSGGEISSSKCAGYLLGKDGVSFKLNAICSPRIVNSEVSNDRTRNAGEPSETRVGGLVNFRSAVLPWRHAGQPGEQGK